MLVLTRKVGQSIRIAENITVTIIEVGRGRVRLGIAAPQDVPVHREELLTRNGLSPQAASFRLQEKALLL